MKEGGDEEPSVSPIYAISNKTECYLTALITKNNTEEITEFETAPFPPDNFHLNWGKYPVNTRFDPKPEINIELQKLYMRGKREKIKIGGLL